MKVTTVEEMRRLDIKAIEYYGISADILMENAGQAVYSVIRRKTAIKNSNFLFFCGTGNNGGDGFVAARKLLSNGANVDIILLGDKNKIKGSARKNFDIAVKMAIDILDNPSITDIENHIRESNVIVDAIFGTGLNKEIGGLFKETINLINQSDKKIFSIDIPSGINGNNAMPKGIAINASHTITFGLPKRGNLLYPGYGYSDNLYVSHISFPPELVNDSSIQVEVGNLQRLPQRDVTAHKGDFADVLFISGAACYMGAPLFSTLSFLKSGGGYARLATPRSISSFLASRGSEIVILPQAETESGSIALQNKNALLALSEEVDMIVIGPGLSLCDETQQLVRELVPAIQKPLLIDGDGITAISHDIELLRKRRCQTILTPHLGEMSRLIGKSIDEIQTELVPLLQQFTKDSHSYVVAKGAHSLTGYPDGRISINLSGNSGMATAGSGDVLVGTIAGMFGLGLDIEAATRTGVFIHGLSGDLAAKEKGEDGITAQDIMEYLPLSVKYYREDYDELTEQLYHRISVC